MKHFVFGLLIGIMGAVLWIIASIVAGVGQGLGHPVPAIVPALMVVGFCAMFGGPLVFWIILPVRRLVTRKKS